MPQHKDHIIQRQPYQTDQHPSPERQCLLQDKERNTHYGGCQRRFYLPSRHFQLTLSITIEEHLFPNILILSSRVSKMNKQARGERKKDIIKTEHFPIIFQATSNHGLSQATLKCREVPQMRLPSGCLHSGYHTNREKESVFT